MKHLALTLVLALVAAPAIAAADALEHVINDAGKSLTLDCGDGGKVVVNGSTNHIAITGGCSKVQVNGSLNTVVVASTDKIAVTGTGNTVTWSKGWKKKAPKIARLGLNNKIARSK